MPEHHRVHRDGAVRRAQAARHRHRHGDHRRPLGRRRREPGDGAGDRRAGARSARPHVRHDHAARRAAAVGRHLRRRVHRRRVRPRVRRLRLRGDPGDPWTTACCARHDDDISAAFTAAARRRWTLLSGTQPSAFRASSDRRRGARSPVGASPPTSCSSRPVGSRTATSSTSRASGVAVDPDTGLVVVDEFQRTSVDGIFALGDICSPWELKHVANHETRVVRHNLAHPESMIRSDHRFVPVGGVHPPADRHRSGSPSRQAKRAAGRLRDRPLRLRRDRRRVGAGGHDRLRQGARRPPQRVCSSVPTSSVRRRRR